MNNTIPFESTTHAPQITVDVNILTMLKQAASCLTEAAGKDVYLAAIGPDMELTIIVEEDVPSVLPCFDEDDAKKYGIDYAIRKDTSEVPPRYLVFFKAPDAEAFNSAFKEYSASLLNKDKRPSVLAKLHELVQAAAELPGKVRHKEQERGL